MPKILKRARRQGKSDAQVAALETALAAYCEAAAILVGDIIALRAAGRLHQSDAIMLTTRISVANKVATVALEGAQR